MNDRTPLQICGECLEDHREKRGTTDEEFAFDLCMAVDAELEAADAIIVEMDAICIAMDETAFRDHYEALKGRLSELTQQLNKMMGVD